jgi:glycosyltransferase involved in cell wall biosynthesis
MRPRLLYLITEDWTFWEIRRDLARLAREAGYEVMIATRVTAHADRIRREGFHLIPITMLRESRNLLREFLTFVELVRIYHRIRPQIVQHVAMKPVLYGSFAAWVTGVPVVINLFGGLGYAFTDRPEGASIIRTLLRRGLRSAIALSRSIVVIQNSDDREVLIREHIVDSSCIRLIAGSGVDIHRFVPVEPTTGDPIVMLVGRMLWDKGVGEFVDAVIRLQKRKVRARFVLVGRVDQGNPTAISETQLQQWVQEYGIEWWGHREDLPTVLGQAALVVLPSYREGLPKVLLEAAACGKAVIATDVPGCRSVVQHHQTGLLVPVRDAAALAEAIAELLGNAELREVLGANARQFVVCEHSSSRISGEFLSLYRELLGPSAPVATKTSSASV